MTSPDTAQVTSSPYDTDLDEIEGGAERLDKLSAGEYRLTLDNVVHVDGDSGVYDIFEWTINEARGTEANPQDSKAKISFKRDDKGKAKEINDKKLFNCLRALNGGETPESRSEYLKTLRTKPFGTLRAKVTFPLAEKSQRPYQKIEYFSV